MIKTGYALTAVVALGLTACSAGKHAAIPQKAVTVELPTETAAFKPSDLPGYQLAQQNCVTCHSPDYVAYQPPSSPRAYWVATVKKMIKPFGAPIDEANVEPIADYLVKTYGAEQPKN